MSWTQPPLTLAIALLPLLAGCGQADDRPPLPGADCSGSDGYELLNISNFSGTESGWFRFADPTPGGTPNPTVEGSNVPVSEIPPPGRCGDTQAIKLEMRGHNFWGSGFGDWTHNQAAARANGTGYLGIGFWARAERDSEKQFLLNVDDGRTLVLPPELPEATPADQDLDGDGLIGPGDIVGGTSCRLPPSEELGEATCYNGGVGGPPSGGTRVPSPGECGNAFHTRVTVGEAWQFYTVPFEELVQWPCPNRVEGGIDPADVAKFEIKLIQGASYELWLDDIAFYR
jgi:hypothetical protein